MKGGWENITGRLFIEENGVRLFLQKNRLCEPECIGYLSAAPNGMLSLVPLKYSKGLAFRIYGHKIHMRRGPG